MLSLPKAAVPFWLFTLMLLGSCAPEPAEDQEVIQALEQSLLSTNQYLQRDNSFVLQFTQDKLSDFATKEKAQIWYPKAQKVHEQSSQMIAYLERLKERLKTRAGYQLKGERAEFTQDNPEVVAQFFRDQGRADTLHQRLEQYRREVLGVDPSILKEFEGSVPLFSLSSTPSPNPPQKYHPAAALALLTRLQNSVLQTENRLLHFCHEHTATLHHDYYTVHRAIVGQSHAYLRAGEPLEITAGVGTFSPGSQPRITIGGKVVPLDESGAAIYQLRASRKPGAHTLPVILEFTDEDGKRTTIRKQVKYTVMEERE